MAQMQTAARVKLSPLNFSGLIASAAGDGMQEATPSKNDKESRAKCVMAWKCTECGSLSEWEDEAEECCEPIQSKAPALAQAACPVCGDKAEDQRDASDCCLWKDIAAVERWAMADAVTAGSTWAEQLLVTA